MLAFALLRYNLRSPTVGSVDKGSAYFLKQVPCRCNLRTAFGPERLAYALAPTIIHIFADRPPLPPLFLSASFLCGRSDFLYNARITRVHTRSTSVRSIWSASEQESLKAAYCITILVHRKFIHLRRCSWLFAYI